MNKFIKVVYLFTLTGLSLVSCSKDENEPAFNTLDIQGEFTVGTKTFTNPSFNLGSPDSLYAYVANYGKGSEYNTIVLANEDIDLGNNFTLDCEVEVYTNEPGTDLSMNARVSIYENSSKGSDFTVFSEGAKATVTKVGEVGGYIEGTFEGDFYYPVKGNNDGPLQIKGKFKVKRVDPEPTK
jgi:hypothetical protein